MKQFLLITTLLLLAAQTHAQKAPVCTWATADTTVHIPINPAYLRSTVAVTADRVLWARIKAKTSTSGAAVVGPNTISLYDTAGNHIKSITMEGAACILAATADAAGNWYIAGRFQDSVKLPGKPAVTTAWPASNKFICRLDKATLNADWIKVIGSTYQDADEGITIAAGKLYTWADTYQANIIYAIDLATGTTDSVTSQHQGGDIKSVAVDDAGNIYVTGCPSAPVNTPVIFGTHPDTNTFSYSIYIVRYKANGSFDWVVKASDITCPNRQLTLHNNNLLYYSGPLNDSLTIGGHFVKKPRFSGGNLLLAALDSSGTVKWTYTVGDDSGEVSISNNTYAGLTDSSFVIFTQARRKVDWGDSVITDLRSGVLSSTGTATVVSYNEQGHAQWAASTGSAYTMVRDMAAGNAGIWIAGLVRDSTAFMMDSVSVPVKPEYTQFLAKLQFHTTQSPTDTTDTTQAVVIIDKQHIDIYPNPATHTLTIRTGNNLQGPLHLQLVNATGVAVYSRDIDATRQDIVLDVAAYPRGVYFAELKHAEGTIVRKVLLQ